ncbi:uncharacterized protein LOC141657294 [Silene latifolia]|uniref:uncharacterized protein LOC141657294 n=1 Tax=Silene latifolia TaxID=37657 RepID=UPI003D784369
MGQSLQKLTPGSETNRVKLMGEIASKYYDEHFSEITNDETTIHFYRAICEVVEEINGSLGNTQFKVPKTETLQLAFNKHHKGKGKSLTKEEFQNILHDVIMETGFTGIGAKDIILYIFGVPVTTLLIKKGVLPKAIPDALFIPLVTSATVFFLAKSNKI